MSDTSVAVSRQRARAATARAAELHAAAVSLTALHDRALAAARAALAPVQDVLVAEALAQIPVARLKDVTEGRLRLTALEAAGYATVRQVLEASRHTLRQVPGVGAQTADQALAAARQIADAVRDTVTVHLDVDERDARTTTLVAALHALVDPEPDLRRAVGAAHGLTGRLEPLLAVARPATGVLRRLFAGRAARGAAAGAVLEIEGILAEAGARDTAVQLSQATVALLREPATGAEAWVDFEIRSPDYYGLLAEISGGHPDVEAAQGFVPADIVDRVAAQSLDDTHLRVSLRGYQSFGARFALVQRRVILGDEMGLGKTVQAIAALAHLTAQGGTRHLVVCPASVLVNWTREVGSRSRLRAVPVHGPERAAAFEEWRRGGGVAITTFETLHTLAPPEETVGMLVVDEAHYVKNPDTRRSRAVRTWIGRTDRTLFLTGTPMENRVAEFRSLVSYLQPALVPDVADAVAGSRAFRSAVAPAYLRRNQEDVLRELPSLIQVDEWEEPSRADEDAYRSAVLAGNFMAMRRAAYADAHASAKLRRLRELVAEAAGNQLKVVVFSYFRDVLDTVGRAIGDGTFGPITGDVAPARRQEIIDEFAARPGHAVLLSQIQAGGVGLNMQAASVVVLCEPQVKPTLEHQAVARAHRMGQVRTVQVHRLLVVGGVDERMLEILATKSRLFDAYARRSDLAESVPDAVDVSDRGLARRIVEEEQLRLAGPPPAVGGGRAL
ncbi:SNF2-related protein [Longispora sp. K20-0274]|uniref:DEAD/DEAH box helicase n=1 Tax=Longispora sp. K20-0274 TaxID=3088255 RepID=UPI00399C2D8B